MHRSFGADGPLSREPRQVAHDKVKEFIRSLDRDFNELISLPELLEYRTTHKLAISDETVEAMFKLAANARQHTQFPGRELNLSHEDVFLAVSCRRSRDPVTRKWSWKASPYHDEWIAMIKCICPQPFNPGAPDYKETKIQTMYEREENRHIRAMKAARSKNQQRVHVHQPQQSARSVEEIADSQLQRSALVSQVPPLAISRRLIDDDIERPPDANERAEDAPLDSFRFRQIDFNVQGEFNAIMKGVDERKVDARAVELRAGSIIGLSDGNGDTKSNGGATSASVTGTSVAAAKKARTMVITAADRETGRIPLRDTDEVPKIGVNGRQPWNTSRLFNRSHEYPIAPCVTGPGSSREEILRPDSTDPLLPRHQQLAHMADVRDGINNDKDMSGIVEKLAGMQTGGVAITRRTDDAVAKAATTARSNAARVRRDERRARAALKELEEPATLKRAVAADVQAKSEAQRPQFVANFHLPRNQDIRLATARDQWDMRDSYNDIALTYRQIKEREQNALHQKLAYEKDPLMVTQLTRDVVRNDRLPFVTCFKDFTDPIPQSQREAAAHARNLLERESYAQAEDRRLTALGLGSAGFGQERAHDARNSTLNGQTWNGFTNNNSFITVFKPIHKLTPLARDYLPPPTIMQRNSTHASKSSHPSSSASSLSWNRLQKLRTVANTNGTNNGSMSARLPHPPSYLNNNNTGSMTARSVSAIPSSSTQSIDFIPARPYPHPPSTAPASSFAALRRSIMLQANAATAASAAAAAESVDSNNTNNDDDDDEDTDNDNDEVSTNEEKETASQPTSHPVSISSSPVPPLKLPTSLQTIPAPSSSSSARSIGQPVPVPPAIAAQQRQAAYNRALSARWAAAKNGNTTDSSANHDPWPNGLLATNAAIGRLQAIDNAQQPTSARSRPATMAN